MTCPTKIEILAEQILLKLPKVSAWQRRFMLQLFRLWLGLRGRYNFVNLGRQGGYTEYTYRKHFQKGFDFLTFNIHLVEQYLSQDRILAFDPSYVCKSGKHTAGVGYFHSGCAGGRRWGLEFSGIAAVDLEDKTALHLEAIQTVEKADDESLLDYYVSILEFRAAQLVAVSSHVVADAYFSRDPFVSRLTGAGFELISRFRKDVRLRYFYQGLQSGKGRHKIFDGKVDPRNLRMDIFQLCDQADDGSWISYEAIVEVQAWKRAAKVVIKHLINPQTQKINGYRIYVSTDLQLGGKKLVHAYRCRYQQEFLFRDAKQHAGLEQGQARNWQKIDFHLNASMTVVSLAKAAHHLDLPLEQRGAFSMADIKTQYANENMALRIFSMCGICPNLHKIRQAWPKIINFGRIAA
jgi:hypothetical protein